MAFARGVPAEIRKNRPGGGRLHQCHRGHPVHFTPRRPGMAGVHLGGAPARARARASRTRYRIAPDRLAWLASAIFSASGISRPCGARPDALLLQHRAELAVGERLLLVLRGDELLDQRAYRRCWTPPASVFRLEPKKCFSSKVPKGVAMYCGGHAADGRLVQAQLVGDLAQHQRLHRDLAVGEEAPFWRSTIAVTAGWCRSAAGCSDRTSAPPGNPRRRRAAAASSARAGPRCWRNAWRTCR